MPLVASSLAQVCRSVATHLAAELRAPQHDISVVIGTPHDAAHGSSAGGKHRLNLFFYRFEPSEFQAALQPFDPWQLRLHCLVTAFSAEVQNQSVGESDLRILGEVLRVLHEAPVLQEVAVDGWPVRLQAVYQPLSVEQLNQLWSTQGDTPLRPSLSFELAVSPVVPAVTDPGAPLTGAFGVGVSPSLAYDDPATVRVDAPVVPAVGVPTGRPDWAPHICLVLGDTCGYTIALELGSQALTDFTPAVWVAGRPGSQVSFEWDTWSPQDGWSTEQTSMSSPIVDQLIDPGQAAAALTVGIPVPFEDHPGQAVLVAVRDWERPDGTVVRLRSNPVVVTLYAP